MTIYFEDKLQLNQIKIRHLYIAFFYWQQKVWSQQEVT